MTVADLLTRLRDLDVRLRVDGEHLRFDAPAGVIDNALRSALTQQKSALIAHLRDGAADNGDSIPRVRRDAPLVVSAAQRRMWFLHHLAPSQPVYNMNGALRLEGVLDIAALEQSIGSLIHRHETLRTTFRILNGEPVQEIAPPAAYRIAIVDLSELDEATRDRELEQLKAAWSRHPYDLTAGPLFRTSLVRLGTDSHILLLSFHHIVCDGWSIGVFVRELTAAYVAVVEGRSTDQDAPPLQYADFAAWQRTELERPGFAQHLEYWRAKLAAPLPVLDLPTDRPRGSVQTFAGGLRSFRLTDATRTALEALAQRQGATLFMVLLAAFKALLSRYSGQQDIVVGSAFAGRNRAELESLIGFFVSSHALRTTVTPAMTVSDLLGAVRATCLEAYEHQDVPVEQLADALHVSRDGGRNPLYRVMFALQSAPSGRFELPRLAVSPVELDAVTSRCDLTLSMAATPGGLGGVIEYSSELFDAVTIDRFAEHYAHLLEQMARDPLRRIGDLSVQTGTERTAIVARGQGARAAYPAAGLGELFAAQAVARPEAVALECGATRLTYRALDARANQVAQALGRAGVGVDARVGVLLPRGIEQIVAVVGVVKAGGAYVALDPTDPAARVVQQLSDADARVVITRTGQVDNELAAGRTVISIDETDAEPTADLQIAVPLEALAYVAFTSGSTGRPKGVAVTHRGVVRLLWGQQYVRLGPDETVLQLAPVSFDASTLEIWGALLHGGRLVIYPERVPEPATLGAELAGRGVTTAWLTASLYNAIIAQAPNALRPLRQLLIGGEVLSVPHVRAGLEALPETALINGYGPTESTTFACCYRIPRPWPAETSIPLGGPIANTTVYVLDATGEPAPAGVPGELYVGGDGLARGYSAAPRLTAEKFVPDGVTGAAGQRLYRTGDTVRWQADGTLAFLGRRDGQIKLRGYRIELDEVEAALRTVAGVAAAAAAVHGAGDARRLVGYVVPAAGVTIDSVAVRAALQREVPAYLVPATIVTLDALPLTPSGKVNREALPVPAESIAVARTAPRSVVERQIADAWCAVLGLGEVGVDVNFFDVGGHSLRLIALQAKLAETFARTIPLVTLFQYPTIAGLAQFLSEGAHQKSEPPASMHPSTEPIAIIGMAGRFPGAPDVDTFWSNLREGRECIRHFTRRELEAAGLPNALIDDAHFVAARGVLEDVDLFDAGLFGCTPQEAALLDPQHRLLLECAWQALEDAGYPAGASQRVRVGVFAGTSPNSYLAAAGAEAVAEAGALQVLISSDKDFLATRLSYKLRLTGPSLTVQTACSTSLVAVHSACQSLRTGECEMAIAGGVSVTVPVTGGYMYQPQGVTSPDGHCRAFDAKAAGTVPGNGVGIVVLKRLDAALRDGDRVYAVIRGTAVNNDGADKVGFTAPSVNGQAAVIAAAQAAAGVTADSISYVEAHGTGTALGDPVEVAALRHVFGDGVGPHTCALGSLKSNVGHLDAAAGVGALIKTVLALIHQEIPASLHFEAPNPELDLGPFHVPVTAQPWVRATAAPRRAGVSSFGIGGTNAHVILEEAPASAASDAAREWQIVPVSARSADAVDRAAANLADWLESHADLSVADVAYTQQVGRAGFAHRRAAVGSSAKTLAAALRTSPTRSVSASPDARLVWLFPGQGAQSLRMAHGLYESEPVFRAEIDACALALEGWLDGDLRAVLYPGTPAEEADARARLAETAWTQVSLVAVELALAALWASWGVRPAVVIGHSVGELAAASVAGVLSRDDAMRLAARRGHLMQQAAPGAMCAVNGSPAEIEHQLGPDLWLAAINSPAQCVVAGTHAALERFEAEAASRGRIVQRLSSAGAFHSALMSAVVDPLAACAATIEIKRPQLTWVSSVTGKPVDSIDASYWGHHVVSAVDWAAAVATARTLTESPIWVELGPGHTLINLARAGVARSETAVPSLDSGDAGYAMASALAQVWTAGCSVDWDALHAPFRRQRVALPTYPFQRQRYWLPAADNRRRSVLHRVSGEPSIYQPLWKQVASPVAEQVNASRRWLLIADDAGLAEQLRASLDAQGETVMFVEAGDRFARRGAGHYAVRPREGADYDALLRNLESAGPLPTDVVHMWAVTESPVDEASTQAREAAYDRCFHSLLHLSRALSRRSSGEPVRITVISNHAQAVTGDEALSPLKALVSGPVRVIPVETPQTSTRHIDIVWPGTPVERVRHALRTVDDGEAVALRGRHVWAQSFERVEAPVDAGAARLRPDGVYLITGGLGGVGSALAELLFDRCRANLILVGRATLPPRDEWSPNGDVDDNDPMARRIGRVQRLESLGATVVVESADVCSFDEMQAVVERARTRFGRIDGVIHAAGIAGGGMIARRSRQAAAAVLAPKVEGTLTLARVFAGEPLDFFVVCSSLAAFLGGLGQVDYCAANASLDAFAQGRWNAGDSRFLTINWDTWRDAGMALETDVPRELTAIRNDALAGGLSNREGQACFLRALGAGGPQVSVCTKDLDALIEAVTRSGPAQSSAVEQRAPLERHARPQMSTTFVAPVTETVRVVCAAFERALGIEPVGVNDNFFELGGHSLSAVELMARLNRRFDANVPVAALYEKLTPGFLARLFDERGGAVRELAGVGQRNDKGRRQTLRTNRRTARVERRSRP